MTWLVWYSISTNFSLLYLFSLQYIPVRNRICKFFLHVHTHKRNVFSSIDERSFPVKHKIIFKIFLKLIWKRFFYYQMKILKYFSNWPCSFSHKKHKKPAFSICLELLQLVEFLLSFNNNLTYLFFANSVHLDTLYYSNWTLHRSDFQLQTLFFPY